MKTFQWTKLFETGINEVDEQHQRLVELVNDLADKIESGEPERIEATLLTLAEYTVHHFQCEEQLMDSFGLARVYVERHRKAHQQFIEQVTEWMGQCKVKAQPSLGPLLDYLVNWLMFHILGDDQSMGRQVAAISSGFDAQKAFDNDQASDDPRTVVLLDGLHRLYADLIDRNEKLVTSQRTLTELNESLEDRVKERTSALAQANEKIRSDQEKVVEAEKMASLGRMVAGFAHEVNTPIGVSVGAISQAEQVLRKFSELLQHEEVSEKDISDHIYYLHEANDLAMSNLKRAASLVTSFKRTAIDQSSEAERDYSLSELINDVISNLQIIFKRTKIDILVNCPKEIQLNGTPGVLTQIFTNLFLNAHAHAFSDGTLEGQLTIDVNLNDNDVSITVIDNGVGMDEVTLKKAFEPFFTTRRNLGGSGLGLYIVYNLVTHELAGNIECDSTPGKGSRFTINFPYHAAVSAGNT